MPIFISSITWEINILNSHTVKFEISISSSANFFKFLYFTRRYFRLENAVTVIRHFFKY